MALPIASFLAPGEYIPGRGESRGGLIIWEGKGGEAVAARRVKREAIEGLDVPRSWSHTSLVTY
jgi:hypothetical protein